MLNIKLQLMKGEKADPSELVKLQLALKKAGYQLDWWPLRDPQVFGIIKDE
jgi:hypothetical protein